MAMPEARRTAPPAGVLPALTILAFGVAGWSRRWTVDDAFINYRVVDQVLAGHGPVFNAGERVEAVTSPLWLAILVVLDVVVPLPLEWSSILAGLALGAAGIAAGSAGALRLACVRRPDAGTVTGIAVPVGAVAYLGTVVSWDFATAGMENGLSIAWLGASFWALAALVDGAPPTLPRSWPSPSRLRRTSALVGLGVVVRPDFAPYSVAFMIAVVAVAWPAARWRGVLRASAAGLAIPVVVQLWRMGFYAQLLPNSVRAKGGLDPWWSQGWTYFADFAGTYRLVVPAVAVVVLLCGWAAHGRASAWWWPVAAIEVGALVHVMAITRAGGDYMHGRLLLPAWFALLLPTFAVPVRELRDWVSRLAVVTIVGWAATAAVLWRPEAGTLVASDRAADALGIDRGDADGIIDARAGTVRLLGDRNPVELGGRTTLGDAVERWITTLGYSAWIDPVARFGPGSHPRARPGIPNSVTPTQLLGEDGWSVAPDVWVFDRLGLADPVVARVEMEDRGTPGHERALGGPWVAAMFLDSSAQAPADQFARRSVFDLLLSGVDPDLLQVDDQRRFDRERSAAFEALGCGDLGEFLEAIREPLTADRFASNIAAAFRLHDLEVPADPELARDQLCG